MGAKESYNLCLGGAYLLLLTAVARFFPEKVRDFLNVNWADFVDDNGSPIKFLPKQLPNYAQKSYESLFMFYSAIVCNDKTSDDQKRFAIQTLVGPINGAKMFRVQLNWEDPSNIMTVLEKYCNDVFNTGKLSLGDSKTVELFMAFLLRSQVRINGIGGIGALRINNNWLEIGR